VAQRAGIKNARELADRAGIHLNSAYGVWNNTARMLALDTLDKLCTLLNVKPGQLFDHEAEPDMLPQAGAPESEAAKHQHATGSAKQKRTKQAHSRAAIAMG